MKSHVRQHFGTVFPLITGNGYTFDLIDYDEKLDCKCAIRTKDIGYVLTPLKPGKDRVTAFIDFGCHEEKFMDPERVAHLERILDEDFNLEPINPGDKNRDMKNLKSCLRPFSPDDLPMIGPMSYYPNVIISAGHGGRGLSFCFATAKIIEDIIE